MVTTRPPLCGVLLLAGWLLSHAPGAAAAPAAGDEPPPEAVVGVLPFQPGDEPNRVLVDVGKEGGEPFVMMLDTGASASVVTPGMARKLGVSVRRAKQTPYRRDTRLGRDLQFWIDTQSSDTGSKTGWEYGLLGGDFLGHYVVEIDFPGRKVRMLDPRHYRVPEQPSGPDEASIPFTLVGWRVHVPIEIGGKSIEVILDTGAPDNAILSGSAAKKLGIDVASLPHFGTGGTALGKMELSFYETESFRFAGFEFDAMPILVAPRGWYNLGGPNDSVIGYDLLQQFVMRIDYPRRRLWLKRAGDHRTRFFGADYAASKRIGAYLMPFQRALHVSGVVAGGAADRFGLRNGDAIVSPFGERPPVAEEVVERIEAGKELTVAREQDGVWIDFILPETTPETPPESTPETGAR